MLSIIDFYFSIGFLKYFLRMRYFCSRSNRNNY